MRLGTQGQRKEDVLDAFFASIFRGKDLSPNLSTAVRVRLLLRCGQRDHLTTWTCTSLLDQLECIQGLADIVRLFSLIFQSSWHLGEGLQDWENAVSHQFLKWIRKWVQGSTDHYRKSFQTQERQERGWWEQPTWV